MTKKDSDNLTENLIFAFARMSEVSQKFMSEDGLQILAGTTFGGLIANAMSKPEFYTQFVKTVPKPRR